MKPVVLFFVISTFFTSLIKAQLPIPTPKFQPDTIYIISSVLSKTGNNQIIASGIDRRNFFEYTPFPKSINEQYYRNSFSQSDKISFRLAVGQEWRYFSIANIFSTGFTRVEFRMEDLSFNLFSDPVIFNIEILPSQFDSLSTRVNRSYFRSGIPSKKWVLLSMPNQDTWLDFHINVAYPAFINTPNSYRLYSIDEKGKAKDVTKDEDLFTPKPDGLNGYWFKTNVEADKVHLKLNFSGSRNRLDSYTEVKGWRFFGIKVDFPLYWLRRDDVRVWSFNPDTQTWREISELEPLYPWAGYAAYSPDVGGISTYSSFGVNYDLVNQSREEILRKTANSFEAIGVIKINTDTLRFGFTSYASDNVDFWDTPLLPTAPDSEFEPAYFLESDKLLTENLKSEQLFREKSSLGFDWKLVIPKGKHTFVLEEINGFDVNSVFILSGKSLFREIEIGVPIVLNLTEKTTATLSFGKKEILKERLIPEEISLMQAYPNPFNPTTTLSFSLPTRSSVKILLFDVSGRLIKTISDKNFNAGFHEILLDGSDLASGVYFVRILLNGNVELGQKITLLK